MHTTAHANTHDSDGGDDDDVEYTDTSNLKKGLILAPNSRIVHQDRDLERQLANGIYSQEQREMSTYTQLPFPFLFSGEGTPALRMVLPSVSGPSFLN